MEDCVINYKVNIRSVFSSCFIFVSTIMLILIVALKVSFNLKGQDTKPNDNTTDLSLEASKFLFFVSTMIFLNSYSNYRLR